MERRGRNIFLDLTLLIFSSYLVGRLIAETLRAAGGRDEAIKNSFVLINLTIGVNKNGI